MADDTQTIVVQYRESAGLVAGMLGCVFGLLGTSTCGILFVPLAALCGVIGLVQGIGRMSRGGIGLSGVALVSAVFGIIVSPSMWLLLGIMAAGH